MRAWVVSALFLIVLSVAPVPASAVFCLKCKCESEIVCLETKEEIQRPGAACSFSCGEPFPSIQPYDEACSTASPDCTPENTRTLPSTLSAAPVLSPWALSIVAILLGLGGVFTLRRRMRER